ncbi:hypothetical protein RHSIM_Rhsim04G0214200 [Rhododendron simsii]|uniref:RRM domain-containing protein n=1 Tax=Rhododendron simsii TaxID=118357 RepID=A0A834LS97_RHOSS|nr:hypothetical protein RHSIM_Rhsim04G0214200 [Rhododendron simsii]
MGRYRSRSRSPSPRRSSKRYDDPRDSSRSRRDRRSPAPSGLLVRNISLDARAAFCLSRLVLGLQAPTPPPPSPEAGSEGGHEIDGSDDSIANSRENMPEDLRIPFERFGAIKDIYLPKNYYTGEPRGFGFVKFRYPEDAADAKEQLNRTVIGGREIRIVFAEENRKTPHEMRRTTRPRSDNDVVCLFFCCIIMEGEVTGGEVQWGHLDAAIAVSSCFKPFPFVDILQIAYSGSLSPARSDSRDRRARDDDYSPRRSRSVSKSVSPRDERNYRSKMKSPRRSRSISRSPPPRDKRNYRSDLRSPSPRVNGKNQHDERYDEQSRSQSPRRHARIPSRSPSRSVRCKLVLEMVYMCDTMAFRLKHKNSSSQELRSSLMDVRLAFLLSYGSVPPECAPYKLKLDDYLICRTLI